MGQVAQKKMKSKKRTKESTANNITTTREEKKEGTLNIKIKYEQSANESKLKMVKPDAKECHTASVIFNQQQSESQSSQKPKNTNKAIVVTPGEIGLQYTENLILKQGVKREELLQEKFGMQELSVWATMGDVEKTRAFFQSTIKRNPNERVECDGSTPLILAADNKHVDIVKLLLLHGADITLTNNEGNNALMTAIKSGDADVINAMWTYRGFLNLDQANKNGFTALHYAAERKWECCVQFLVGNGASPNSKTSTGETPLMIAARLGDRKTAETLVLVKADILMEDNRGRTAICLAFLGSKKGVLGYLLDKLPEERTETFVKSRLYYMRHPFMEDYREFCEVYLFRLLLRLTWKSTFRDAFYNQKVILVVLDRMKEIQHFPNDMIQLSSLLCSIMFMFNKQVDIKLIKQYIYNNGPDFTIDTVRYYTEKLNMQEKDSIVFYLPMIGITEVPEGVAWLRKNYLRVSEYSNFYKGNLAENLRYALNETLSDIDPEFMKVMGPVWEKFHRILFDIQQKQREKTMMELLQDEEREKERRVKKREKRQQKRQVEKDKKAQRQDEVTSSQHISSPSLNGTSDTIYISQNSNDNENESASRSEVKPKNKNKNKKLIEPKNEMKVSNFTEDVSLNSEYISEQMIAFKTHSDRWQTVQTKKHSSKEKEKGKDKQETNEVDRKDQGKSKKSQQPRILKKAQDKTKPQRNSAQPVRWADVAKGNSTTKAPERKDHSEDKKSGFSYDDEFPTLDGNNAPGRNAEMSTIGEENSPLYHSPNTTEEEIKTYFTNSSERESCGNQSSQSGFSLSSFECETEQIFSDEKFYSDEESSENTLTHEPLPEDNGKTILNNRSLNDIRSSITFPTSYQSSTGDINSETLQYLVDAYIASDTQSTSANQFFEAKDIGKTPDYADKHRFESQEKQQVENDYTNPYQRDFEIHNARADIEITEEKYARDPSPTKSPRKRFTPQKRTPLNFRKQERATLCRKTEILEEAHVYESSKTDIPARYEDYYCDTSLAFGESEDVNETQPFIVNDLEVLPAWYTDADPLQEYHDLNDLNDKETEALVLQSGVHSANLSNKTEKLQTGQALTASGCFESKLAPKDNIADDPCVVQYLAHSNTSNVNLTNRHIGVEHKDHSIPSDNNINPTAQTNPHSMFSFYSKNMRNPYETKANFSAYGPDQIKEQIGGYQQTKKTAVVKPISKHWQHARHSVNSALGQSILENACRLESKPIEVLYPSDLRDSPEPYSTRQTSYPIDQRDSPDPYSVRQPEPDYFPSFHDETKLSSYYQPDAISVFHKLQQMQLIQLKMYYDTQLLNKLSVYNNDFPYYASCTGLTHQQLNEHLGIKEQHSNLQHNIQDHPKVIENTYQSKKNFSDQMNVNHTSHAEYLRQVELQREAAEQVKSSSTISFLSSENDIPVDHDITGRKQTNVENLRNSATINPYHDNGYATDYNLQNIYAEKKHAISSEQMPLKEKLNPAETARNATQEMADRVLQDIKAAYDAMVANSIKSRRWKDKLLDIRNMSPSDINIIGNIVFPKVNQYRFVIRSRPETIMLGFLLNGTPVAVRIINWRSRHLIRDDLQNLINQDVSKYFMTKYRDFSFLDGNYYIAMDLYEYTLDEYLYKLKTDGQDTSLCTNKLIWQFLRGLNSIHQHCLMVHGEIRPSNIVIDISGNLRIAGYGLGRRVSDDKGLSDSSQEEDNCWIAPELLLQEQGDTFKADIWSAGMIMYFILSGGKEPMGTNHRDVVWNISKKHHLGTDSIGEEAFHLLSIMMSLNKTERPATSEALRHPYFWAEEKRLRFVLIAGSDVLRDLKAGIPMSGGTGDSMIDILNSVSCGPLSDWMVEIDLAVMKEMRAFRQYKNNAVELVLFVYNCCLHFEKMSAKAREVIDEPCKYFLTKFPALFMTVYQAISRTSRTEKTCYKPFF